MKSIKDFLNKTNQFNERVAMMQSKGLKNIYYQMRLTKNTFKIISFPIKLDEKIYFVPQYSLDRPAAQAILQGSLYEPETHKFVRFVFDHHCGSMIHAGAFFGDMLPSFSSYVQKKLYAFEPVLENYILSSLCVRENQLENVLLFNCCLGGKSGTLRINSRTKEGLHAGGLSHVAPNGDLCTSISLDDMNFESLILIQLDLEGYELSALEGGIQTINFHRPIIAIEDNSNNCSLLLKDLDYIEIFHLPDLKVWCPNENSKFKENLSKFSRKLCFGD